MKKNNSKKIIYYVSVLVFLLNIIITISFGYELTKEISTNENINKEISNVEEEIKKEEVKIDEVKKEEIKRENTVHKDEVKDKHDKVIYLTFDDGPSINTYKILEILKKNNIKATFFVVGKNINQYKQIVDEGHTIAIHTYTHNYKKIYASVDSFFNDLYKVKDAIKNQTGVESKITRFPGGSSNTIASKQLKREIIKRLNEEGYTYQDWNCDSTDASGNNVSIDKIVHHSTVMCPYKKINLLMHDSQSKITTVEALPQIIEYYKSKGYTFEKLDTYSPKFQHMK